MNRSDRPSQPYLAATQSAQGTVHNAPPDNHQEKSLHPRQVPQQRQRPQEQQQWNPQGKRRQPEQFWRKPEQEPQQEFFKIRLVRQLSMQINEDIKDEWGAAAQALSTSHPRNILPAYFSRMHELCSIYGKHIEFRHFTAIIHGTAQVWKAANQHQGSWQNPTTNGALRAFLGSQLATLRRLIPMLDNRGVSSILSSFVVFKINPDHLEPGIVDSLSQQWMHSLETATGQSSASMMLACANLQLNPCQGAMTAKLMEHLSTADVSEYQAQDFANILYGIAMVSPDAPPPEFLEMLCSKLLEKLQVLSLEQQQQLKCQHIAKSVYSLVQLKLSVSTSGSLAQLVDLLCNLLFTKLQTAQPREQPDHRELATFAWSLQRLKYIPLPELEAAMVDRMTQLCGVIGQQPNATSTGTFLLACADLQLSISEQQADTLAAHFISQQNLSSINIAKVAWSLAVLGYLKHNTCLKLLQQTRSVCGNFQPNTASLTQLYQAVDWLCPSAPPGSTQAQTDSTCGQIKNQLHALGPRPQSHELIAAEDPAQPKGSQSIFRVLNELGLNFTPGAFVLSYWMNAVVRPTNPYLPQGSRSLLVLISAGHEQSANDPTRVLGRYPFRLKLLSQQGSLVEVHPGLAMRGGRALKDFLQQRLRAAAGGSLEEYRQ